MENKLKFIEKHCKVSKNNSIALSEKLVEAAVKVHNCPIKVTCDDFPGEVSTYSLEDLMKEPLFQAGPYQDKFSEGTYVLNIYPWKGVKEEKVTPVKSTPSSKIYQLETPIPVTTYQKEVTLIGYIAYVLETTRKKREYSQTDLARLANISQPTISRIESKSEENITINTLATLAEALNIPIIDFFPKKLV